MTQPYGMTCREHLLLDRTVVSTARGGTRIPHSTPQLQLFKMVPCRPYRATLGYKLARFVAFPTQTPTHRTGFSVTASRAARSNSYFPTDTAPRIGQDELNGLVFPLRRGPGSRSPGFFIGAEERAASDRRPVLRDGSAVYGRAAFPTVLCRRNPEEPAAD